MTTPHASAPPRFGLLRLIAVYKIAKVVLLLGATYGVFRLRDASILTRVYQWASTLPSGLEQDVVKRGLAWFSGLSPKRVDTLGSVTFAYATIFAVEGVGLWMRRRWAEWLTIVITASLIPLEIWECVHRPTLGKASVLVANAAIVWYLIIQLKSQPESGSVT
jgi:uncharacterized membrane protein (DUF2068 family)